MFNKDIVLDKSAFAEAAVAVEGLMPRLTALQKDLEKMLKLVEQGCNTPAGKKLVQSCRASLLEPISDQALALKHVSETLKESKDRYATVFDEYEKLIRKIQQVQDI